MTCGLDCLPGYTNKPKHHHDKNNTEFPSPHPDISPNMGKLKEGTRGRGTHSTGDGQDLGLYTVSLIIQPPQYESECMCPK
jgi:hypothetical protein